MTSVSTKRKRRTRPARLSSPVKKSRGRVIASLLFDCLFYLMVVTLLLGSLLFVANKDPNKSFMGYRFYNVLTNSMVPQKGSLPGGFHAGDITIVQMATFDEVKKNDIVTFKVGDEAYLTHRLLEKLTELNGEEGDFIVTKGDANNSQDPPVAGDRLVGKVVFVIPYTGTILKFLREHFVVCLVFVLSLFGFIWVFRFYFDSPEEPQKRSSRQTTSNRTRRKQSSTRYL